MSPRTPEAPPLSRVLDQHEARARGGEVVALVVGFIGGLVLGGATVALVPAAIERPVAAPESRLLVPIEKCVRMRSIQGGRQP